MPDLREWSLACANHETGDSVALVVVASSATRAREIAAESGFVVAEVLGSSKAREGASEGLTDHSRERAKEQVRSERRRRPVDVLSAICVAVVFLLGLSLILVGATMDTAPTGVHNSGLLNERLGWLVVGSAVLICAFLLGCTAAIIRAIRTAWPHGKPLA